MREYDFNTKEPIEYKDILFKFSYVFFLLLLIVIVLEQRKSLNEYKSTEDDSYSLRSDVIRFKSNINDSQNYIDTIIKYNYTRPNDPLTGNRIKYYGE